jgi:hypothetical protein
MLTRRQLLVSTVLGGIGTSLAASVASAFSIETTPKVAANAFALACKPLGGSDHSDLAAQAQTELRAEIARGTLPANAEQIVICPICGCRIIVTADASY